jgi:hypothetical protein
MRTDEPIAAKTVRKLVAQVNADAAVADKFQVTLQVEGESVTKATVKLLRKRETAGVKEGEGAPGHIEPEEE